MKQRVIGLLGGSFNPAHEGHLHISLYALHKLKLDEVWWLVSPHNPLKEKDSLADYHLRLESARAMAHHPRLRVSDIEHKQGLFYTFKTIAYLKRRFPHHTFVWLMGADNLEGFHRWQRWHEMLYKIPIIVFDRAPFSHRALRSKTALAARKFAKQNNQIGRSWQQPLLHVAYMKRAPQSSTELRKTLGKGAFLRHN
jgi:nicotinate-nucleotide adenylyltransferase